MILTDENGRCVPSPGMKKLPFDEAISNTFLGQAHIAGTGPKGATCRECKFWHSIRSFKDQATGKRHQVVVPPPHGAKDGKIKKAQCRRPIRGKAKKAIPHHASACRLFEANPNPPPAQIDVAPKKGKNQ